MPEFPLLPFECERFNKDGKEGRVTKGRHVQETPVLELIHERASEPGDARCRAWGRLAQQLGLQRLGGELWIFPSTCGPAPGPREAQDSFCRAEGPD